MSNSIWTAFTNFKKDFPFAAPGELGQMGSKGNGKREVWKTSNGIYALLSDRERHTFHIQHIPSSPTSPIEYPRYIVLSSFCTTAHTLSLCVFAAIFQNVYAVYTIINKRPGISYNLSINKLVRILCRLIGEKLWYFPWILFSNETNSVC